MAPLILWLMRTTVARPTPSSRDAGLRLRRRLTLGSAAAASVATALFAVIGAMTIPGTEAASTAAASMAASSTSSSASTTTSQAATTVTQAPATATTHAVSGGSG